MTDAQMGPKVRVAYATLAVQRIFVVMPDLIQLCGRLMVQC